MTVKVAWVGLDRDQLMSALEQRGLTPNVVEQAGEAVIEIPCAEGDNARLCDDVMTEVESLLAELELPLVPEQGDGQVFIRPPAG